MLPNPKINFAHSKGIDLPIMYVYLAGYMSGEKIKETTEWRIKIREHYKNWEVTPEIRGSRLYTINHDLKEEDIIIQHKKVKSYPIAFLDPYNGKEVGTIDKSGLKSSIPPKAIIQGDYMSVKKADVIIANMSTFGAKRPLTGTQWELAWAWQMGKPFILITDEDNYIHHPFCGNEASWIVKDTNELLELGILETFYRRVSGAIYE